MNKVLGQLIVLLMVGCQSFNQSDTSADDRIAACVKADEIEAECEYIDIDCGEPLSVTCSYQDISVVSSSCSCDHRIYGAICDAGITDNLEALQEGIVCVTESEN